MALVAIRNLEIDFLSGGLFLRAVDKVSISIDPGEIVCLVGESGSGKSATALAIGRLLPTPSARYSGGEIMFDGEDVLRMSIRTLSDVRGRLVSYVFQEPAASLNPVVRIGNQIKEMLKLHRPTDATDEEVVRLLNLVRIPAPELRFRDYPFQLSGGMQQRAMIAMALASRPQLLVADEPTTALDVTVQAQILDLLKDIRTRFGTAIFLITHNLGIISGLADRIAVMYAGQIVESGPAQEVLRAPLHPYTKALIDSMPSLNNEVPRLKAIPGTVPRLGNFPSGCRFHPRCPSARPECATVMPELSELAPGRWVRCLYAQPPQSNLSE